MWRGSQIVSLSTRYIQFDEFGRWDSFANDTDVINELEGADLMARVRRMRIPDMNTARRAKDFIRAGTWQISAEDTEAVSRDTVARERAPLPILRGAIKIQSLGENPGNGIVADC